MHQEPHTRRVLAIVAACVLAGLAVVALAVTQFAGGKDSPRRTATAPPVPPAATTVPAAATTTATSPSPSAAAARATRHLSPAQQTVQSAQDAWRRIFRRNAVAHVPAEWVSGFFGLYATSQATFGVNWLLLASIHRQESAFSTAPSTYHGLNWIGCCAGPMQFNVTNGPVSTWDRYKGAYKAATRPTGYPHETRKHPSVYDDYDAIMAAGDLLRDDGAGLGLDQAAWNAAYLYYGVSYEGVDYADEVLARAIGWSQNGFAANTGVDRGLVESVHAAWGEPVRRALEAAEKAARTTTTDTTTDATTTDTTPTATTPATAPHGQR